MTNQFTSTSTTPEIRKRLVCPSVEAVSNSVRGYRLFVELWFKPEIKNPHTHLAVSEPANALGEINLAIPVHLGQSINSGAINSDGRDSYRHRGILMQPNRGAFRLTLRPGRGGPLPYRVDSQMLSYCQEPRLSPQYWLCGKSEHSLMSDSYSLSSSLLII